MAKFVHEYFVDFKGRASSPPHKGYNIDTMKPTEISGFQRFGD